MHSEEMSAFSALLPRFSLGLAPYFSGQETYLQAHDSATRGIDRLLHMRYHNGLVFKNTESADLILWALLLDRNVMLPV